MSDSLEEKIGNIRRAAYDQFAKPSPSEDVWVRDVLENPDSVIVQIGEEMFQVGYSIASDGNITFADRDSWEKVELQYVKVSASELKQLSEVVRDGERTVLKVFRTSEPTGPLIDALEREMYSKS